MLLAASTKRVLNHKQGGCSRTKRVDGSMAKAEHVQILNISLSSIQYVFHVSKNHLSPTFQAQYNISNQFDQTMIQKFGRKQHTIKSHACFAYFPTRIGPIFAHAEASTNNDINQDTCAAQTICECECRDSIPSQGISSSSL